MPLGSDLKAFAKLNMLAMLRKLIDSDVAFFTNAGVPTSGSSGTYAGYAGPASMLFDTTNGTWYVNAGTKASPTWNKTSDVAYQTSVSLTNANVLNIRATPITLVAAPGAGKFLEFVSAELVGQFTGAYTETADNLAVRLVNGTGVIVSQAIEMTGFIDQTGAIRTNALPKIDAIATGAQLDNQALVLHNTGDGEFGGGNAANTLIVKVNYRVWPTS